MPDFKSIGKGGWHPSWDNKVSINRNNYKNPKGWVGKNESSQASDRAANHQSAPLSSLRDPASFAPPPKHINYHGADAVATQSPTNALSPSPSQAALPAPAPPPRINSASPQNADRPQAPPTPYRMNTSGLRTDNLPPPPVRQRPGMAADTSTQSPAISRTHTAASTVSPASPGRSQPQLPPRLPRRQNSNPSEHTPPPPPTYGEATGAQVPPPNHNAVSRLGQAGVSVPGFGINRTTSPSTTERTKAHTSNGNAVNELQSRFARMSHNSSTPSSPSGQGPISAPNLSSSYSTINKARADPSSVSLSDARNAATTANAVNQRYGSQIGSGLRASGLVSGNGTESESTQNINSSGFSRAASLVNAAGAVGKKPPPPPPPAKRSGLGSAPQSNLPQGDGAGSGPPPVPLGSKPRF